MPVDPYAACTCGSGKKFKWCCGPIHEQLERAYQLDANGQHEAALGLVDEVAAANPDNPEVFGRKAVLLYQMGRDEDAEAALEQAFQINPNYPYGFFLRGRLRQMEGEDQGAVLLFRKAAEHYDPRSHSILVTLYAAIAECELRLNRPVACRAAWEMALVHEPTNAELNKALKEAFGDGSVLPWSARRSYQLKEPAKSASPERKQAWQQALQQHTTGRLKDAQQAFEQLVNEDAENAPAWYNLGLIKAWLGDNVGALQALDEYVRREPDETQAAEAAALTEVLRCGTGVPEDQTDYLEHGFIYQIHDGAKIQQLLQILEQEVRMVGGQIDSEQQLFTAILLEAPKLLAGGAGVPQMRRFAAHLAVVQHLFRISSPNRQQLLTLAADLEEKAAGSLQSRRETATPLPFRYILVESVVFPVGQISEEEFNKHFTGGLARFLEEVWLHRPLRSLGGIPPIDGAGHDTLRKKVRGVIQFLEECARTQNHPYDFNQLRRKLGLQAAAAGEATDAPDISAMGAAELAALSSGTLNEEQLEQAYQTARKLDARELAANFLQELVGRPPQPERPDRFALYGQLIQHALEENNTGQALEYVDAGEKADCEQNEGRRRNDYELWRGRLHARRGELDQAQDVFERLIARVPSNLRYRSTATESMLSARDGTRALCFAEDGLTAARQQKDRDSEQHFMELAEAAKRQTK